MKKLVAMTIGAGIVFTGTAIALFSAGVITSKVTDKILEEIFG